MANTLLYTTTIFLQCFPCILIYYYAFRTKMRWNPRLSLLSVTLILVLSSVIISNLLLDSTPPSLSNHHLMTLLFSFMVISGWVYAMISVADGWSRKLFVFIFGVGYCLCIMALTNVFHQLRQDTSLEALLLFGGLTIFVAALLPTILYAEKKILIPCLEQIPKKTWNLLSFSTLIFILVFALEIIYSTSLNLNTLHLIIALFLPILGLVLIYFLILMFIRESLERYILIERDIFYRHYWELQSQRYNALMDTQNEMRHLRHDMRHHFQVLAGMATVEDATKAPARLKAIQDYLKDSHTTVGNAPMVLSRNPIINTLIPYYLDIAKAANLDFTYHIDIPDRLSLNDSDLCIILGNLLENATDGAKTSGLPRPRIILNILTHQNQLIITLDNDFEGALLSDPAGYISTKHAGRGIGILSIQNTVKENGGSCHFEADGTVFHASLRLVLA